MAEEAIEAGRVTVGGAPAGKPSRLVSPAEPIEIAPGGRRFASRGGDKLAPAIAHFDVDVRDRRVLDAGASTGGFTDCLLQFGARRVLAVDVGWGQLDARLRADPRVVVIERTNIRDVTPELLLDAELSHDARSYDARSHDEITGSARDPASGPAAESEWQPVDMVTADLSFISLTKVVPVLLGPLVRAGGDAILLVKPQFEAGRSEVSRGRGVVRAPATWYATLSAVACALQDAGAAMMGVMPSPLTGPSGNREFFLHARAGADPGALDDVDGALWAAVRSCDEASHPTTVPVPSAPDL
jgi:23S rRNA (cytidine1920-2'-O)/16S rRNA (cytidine1409-2'-O)-methyltransferase